MAEFTYNRKLAADALRKVGIKTGNVVFSHSNIGYFGYPDEGKTPKIVFETLLGAFLEVIGPEGTLVVPTYTYSFPKGEAYNPAETPSTCGIFTEMLRCHPRAKRSDDPIFSVAALGGKADEMTRGVSNECFGEDSFWGRFLRAGGIICNMNLDSPSTFTHYVERCLQVPYRYHKFFPGRIVRDGKACNSSAIHFCQDMNNPDTVAKFELLDSYAREAGLVKTAQLGRGAMVSMTAADSFELIKNKLPENPYFLTVAGHEGRKPRIFAVDKPVELRTSLPENASAMDMIRAVWALPRDLVSDGYDASLLAFSEQIKMTIHEFPSGTPCWSWILPEKWTCRKASLSTVDGRKIFSYEDNPLHVASYSQPFSGEISRKELFEHMTVHPRLADAIPFKYNYYNRRWDLCCSRNLRDSLKDDRYIVDIDVEFSFGKLKVGEVVIPGESEECIVLCAHLCHPYQVNDGLSGVAAGIKVMQAMAKRRNHYTYRLLITPETIGSVAFLSRHEELIPKMKGGLFLEMLALDFPHVLQLSYEADSPFDRSCQRTLAKHDSKSRTGPFLQVVTNDERQFNAPSVRVPMLSLSRVIEQNPDYPYYENYHTHFDSPENSSERALENSISLVIKMLEEWDRNRIPKPEFKGEIFLSRYGIYFNFDEDPKGSQALFDIMFLIDGGNTLQDIADKARTDLATVERILKKFHEHGLISYN